MASESLPPESPSSTRSPSLIMSKSLSAWLSGLRIFAGGLASFLDWRLDLGASEEATVATAVETPDSSSASVSSPGQTRRRMREPSALAWSALVSRLVRIWPTRLTSLAVWYEQPRAPAHSRWKAPMGRKPCWSASAS